MTEKTTVIDLIGFDVAGKGHMEVRFAKLMMVDGVLIDRAIHRTALPPGADIDAQIEAVNADLAVLGYGPVPTDDVALLKATAKRKWTKAVLDAYAAELEAQRAADEEARHLADERASVASREAEGEYARLVASIASKLRGDSAAYD